MFCKKAKKCVSFSKLFPKEQERVDPFRTLSKYISKFMLKAFG